MYTYDVYIYIFSVNDCFALFSLISFLSPREKILLVYYAGIPGLVSVLRRRAFARTSRNNGAYNLFPDENYYSKRARNVHTLTKTKKCEIANTLAGRRA